MFYNLDVIDYFSYELDFRSPFKQAKMFGFAMLSLAWSYMLFPDMLRGGGGGCVGGKGGGSGSEGREQERNWGGAGPENKKLDKIFYSGHHNTHNQQLKQSFSISPFKLSLL